MPSLSPLPADSIGLGKLICILQHPVQASPPERLVLTQYLTGSATPPCIQCTHVTCHRGPHLQLTCGYLLKCPPPTLLLFPKGTGLCESSLWILQAQAQHTASSHLGTLRAQVVVMCVRVTILPDDYPSRSHSPLCTKATHIQSCDSLHQVQKVATSHK